MGESRVSAMKKEVAIPPAKKIRPAMYTVLNNLISFNNIYTQLKTRGYDDENIILSMTNDESLLSLLTLFGVMFCVKFTKMLFVFITKGSREKRFP